MARILVTGSRHWTDRAVVVSALADQRRLLGDAVLVHGDARGLDRLAAWVWSRWGLPVEVHPADWERFGRAAGHRRNAEMVKAGADVCLAFPIGASPGTRSCAAMAQKAGIPVLWCSGALVLWFGPDRER